MTFFNITWLVIGSVLIWHIYNPLSFLWTISIVKVQELWPLWLTLILGLFVTIWVWMAKMALESDLSHATWKVCFDWLENSWCACAQAWAHCTATRLYNAVYGAHTLCPPRCFTTQVNWADLPAATVMFSKGEMNPGSNPVTTQEKV